MIKVSDYIVNFLVRQGIKDNFMISGGGIIHLVESVGSNKRIKYYCNYNEQATAYCAEGYSRCKNKIGVCLVTTGPGSTNALSGVASAWVDSVPLIVISGQVKRELIADYAKLRQIGEQEINIIDIVKPVTKYARTVNDPQKIRQELEKAFFIANFHRPGPVWLNIPLDVQGSFVSADKLPKFRPKTGKGAKVSSKLKGQLRQTLKLLKTAQRPLMLLGNGLRLSGAESLLKQLFKYLRIPLVVSFNGMDLIADNHHLLIGKPGIIGQRRANFAIQNADCLLSIGSRLNIKIVGYNYRRFAPGAKKIIVDIDRNELSKPTISADLAIQADAKQFLSGLLKQLKEEKITARPDWFNACRSWRKRYPNIENKHPSKSRYVNAYLFYQQLSQLLTSQDVVVSGNGLAALALYQAFKIKPRQRVFTNNGYGAMGWGLPASIGACIANKGKRTICITGDGSLQMNIQELEFIKYHHLPIKIFVLNNKGYTSIRLTQNTFFKGHYVAADQASGVGQADFQKIAYAYNLRYLKIGSDQELNKNIMKVLNTKGPYMCDLNISAQQGIAPKVSSYQKKDGKFESRPLEDMFPFLPRKELEENMRISNS